MKFTFEADMVRGMCCRCPICYYDDEGFAHCGLCKGITCLEVEPNECPLKEANEVVWHPYPAEKPTEVGFYLVSITSKFHAMPIVLQKRYEGDDWGFDVHAYDTVIAWAELPRPYEGNSSTCVD